VGPLHWAPGRDRRDGTPARTIEGVREQLRFANDLLAEFDGDFHLSFGPAIRNALATLDRLAAGRAQA
jgi:hypothetical protein